MNGSVSIHSLTFLEIVRRRQRIYFRMNFRIDRRSFSRVRKTFKCHGILNVKATFPETSGQQFSSDWREISSRALGQASTWRLLSPPQRANAREVTSRPELVLENAFDTRGWSGSGAGSRAERRRTADNANYAKNASTRATSREPSERTERPRKSESDRISSAYR